MREIADSLTMIGNNFPLVVAGSAEILLGLYLIGKMTRSKLQKQRKTSVRGEEKVFLEEMNVRGDEVCIVVRRNDMMPIYVSGNLKEMLNVTLKEVQNDVQKLDSMVDKTPETRGIWECYLDSIQDGEQTAEIRLKNGKWIHMAVSNDPGSRYSLLSFVDTTKTHDLLDNYELLLQKAEEESKSKTTFLNRMSHEIRTPMNGIMGMLTLAEDSLGPDSSAADYLSKAGELSGHLLSLINDILDMSRIEAGKVELENKSFSLRQLGAKLYDMFAGNLKAAGVDYEVRFEDVTVDYVMGDELRLSQVIINFLSNSVKFTKNGEITVTFKQMMLHDGMVDLMICVHDTGIGMESEFINRIFRPFEQESIDTSKKYGGSGLGMAITDNLVKLMGGEIVVRSVPGKGSDFSVFLHLPQADKPVETPEVGEIISKNLEVEEENAFQGRRILMAEDNEINAMIAEEILTKMGAEVDVAENGQEAVECFASHSQNYYDFILMDVQMPVMDGRTAASEIRKLKRPDAQSILIFALSADAFVEDERKSLESGMNGHYAKPVNYKELQKNIGVFLRKKEKESR